MAEAVYLLCAITSLACAVLLQRNYARTGMKLILWTSLCFVGFAINNVILFVDLAIMPDVDLSLWRNFAALGSVGVLLYGLIASELA